MSLLISVVIPSRNRPLAVMRLLQSLRMQTLHAEAFEVIVVDDGSDPPLQIDATQNGFDFAMRIIRRTSDHGAHAARCTGLRAAAGARVLFLDDDVIAESTTLAAHADPGLSDRVALGRTLYPDLADSSPFFRYMAAFYARCERQIREKQIPLTLSDYYVCNSSSPRKILVQAFDDIADKFNHPVEGEGFDESLLAQALAASGIAPAFAPQALLWHMDVKTLAQARAECLKSGQATGRMLLESHFPNAARNLREAIATDSAKSALRRAAMRCFWIIPVPFLRLADTLALLAERGPQRHVPRWTCHLPVRLARWEGMRRTIPSFNHLLRLAEPGVSR